MRLKHQRRRVLEGVVNFVQVSDPYDHIQMTYLAENHLVNVGNADIPVNADLVSLLLTSSSYLSIGNIHARVKYSETPEQRPTLAGVCSEEFSKKIT